jgi:NTP pyrophosphatase (non-canonical NTP hydrolase)
MNSQANTYVSLYPPDWTPDNPDLKPILIRYDQFVLQLFKLDSPGMMKMHAALGICGEAGETADCIKKEVIYGKPIDRDNLIEELGDLRFFIQAVQNIYGISETEVLQANCNKLALRYKELRYSDEAAILRADKME